MARRMKLMHVSYCDIADNSEGKYGSAFLVLQMLLHYGGPLEKLPTSLMLNYPLVWAKCDTCWLQFSDIISKHYALLLQGKEHHFSIQENNTTFSFLSNKL